MSSSESTTTTTTATTTTTKSKLHPYWVNFLSGGIALSVSFAIMHPLDTYKTILQSTSPNTATTGSVKTTTRIIHIKSLNHLINNYKILSRGLLSSSLPALPQGGLRLATYESLKSRDFPSILSVIVADIASSAFKVPRELITARLQTAGSSSIGPTNTTTGSRMTALSIAKSIVAQHGIKGLFKGFWTTSARDWPFMIILFETYEKFNHFHAKLDDDSSDSKIIPILYGGASGALAAWLTTPFDVLRTRIMTDRNLSFNSKNNTKIVDTIKNILSIKSNLSASPFSSSFRSPQSFWTSALKASFRGSLSRSIWWFSVCSIFFPFYEYLQESFDPQNK